MELLLVIVELLVVEFELLLPQEVSNSTDILRIGQLDTLSWSGRET